MEDEFGYDRVRVDAQKLYFKRRFVWSPSLNENVYFTAEGFNHIIFKGSRSERERPSQMLRFKLLSRAVKLIERSTTYQEYEEVLRGFEVKSHKKRVYKTRRITYWGIIAIIDGRKIKVLLRRIGDDGQLHFWSIVPAWITNKYRDIKLFRTMKGNPEED